MDLIERKILRILNSYYTELDAGPGSPFYEYVVRPASFLWTKHQEGAGELLKANTLEDPESMTVEDLDRIMTRYFEVRKQGSYVYATLRLFFDDQEDYTVSDGILIEASNNKTYETLGSTVLADDLLYSETEGYYADFGVVSTDIGGEYNLYAYQLVDPAKIYHPIAAHITKAYFVSNSTDGGTIESNIAFYNRVKNTQSLKNLTTYRGVRATLTNIFNVKRVVVVGLRDLEMRRDIVDLPGVGLIHRGGCADFYADFYNMAVIKGYNAPLAFPLTFQGYSLAVSPIDLMTVWNTYVATNAPDVDPNTRGSVREEIPTLSLATNMDSLTANMKPLHDFVVNTDYEAIHTDNLVRQMWPLVVLIQVSITDTSATIVDAVKLALIDYINNLPAPLYPNQGDLIHVIKKAGAAEVHTPLSVACYYLNEQARIESIAFDQVRDPETSLLVPAEDDSLRFTVSVPSQISSRNVRWYTQSDLIRVTLV